MRVWNGLNVNDRVKYNNKEYIVKELSQEDNKKYCKLVNLNNDETLENIPIIECKKL